MCVTAHEVFVISLDEKRKIKNKFIWVEMVSNENIRAHLKSS